MGVSLVPARLRPALVLTQATMLKYGTSERVLVLSWASMFVIQYNKSALEGPALVCGENKTLKPLLTSRRTGERSWHKGHGATDVQGEHSDKGTHDFS